VIGEFRILEFEFGTGGVGLGGARGFRKDGRNPQRGKRNKPRPEGPGARERKTVSPVGAK